MIHIENNGKPKCGAQSWGLYRKPFAFATEQQPATCKSCLGLRRKTAATQIEGDWKGKIFHRSCGYDMTWNIFCVVIDQTDKSLLAVECVTETNGKEDGWTSEGKAWTKGVPKTGARPFRLFLRSRTNYEYWAGGKEHWSLWDGKPCYENHCD